MSDYKYKISMLGPSRVGKTSLIASIFEGAKDELLVGTPFNIKPKNLATEKAQLTQEVSIRVPFLELKSHHNLRLICF